MMPTEDYLAISAVDQ